MFKKYFKPGDRVKISDDYHWAQGMTGEIGYFNWNAMNGTVGTVGKDGCGRVTLDAKRKKMITYYVNFDYRCDDGSGDGPYSGGGIEDKYLEFLQE